MTNWDQVKIHHVQAQNEMPLPVLGALRIKADVFLNELDPEDVDVEIYYGPLSPWDEFTERNTTQMTAVDSDGSGNYRFRGEILCRKTGRYGFTVRILPSSRKFETPNTGSLVIWAQEQAVEGAPQAVLDFERMP
jgi:starch phosphorylase